MSRSLQPNAYSRDAFRAILVLSSASFSDSESAHLPGIPATHINAVLAGTEEPSEALLSALYLVRQADGTYTLITGE